MNLKHIAIKVICKRMLLDHRAQPVAVEVDKHRYDVLELIDLQRFTIGESQFSILFKINDMTVRVSLSFTSKTKIEQFDGYTHGNVVDTVSIAYQRNFNGIDALWTEEVMDEIMCHVESNKR